LRQFPHAYALRIGAIPELGLDLTHCIGMAIQIYLPRRGHTLAGNVIRCRADAAKAETQITAMANAAQLVLQQRGIIPRHAHPVELQATLG